MRSVYTTLSGFSKEQVSPLGEISLLITDNYHIIRNDFIYDALSSDISVLKRAKYHHVGISRCKKMYLEQTVTIGRQLPTKAKQELIKLPKDNADIFAWQYSNMTGFPRTLRIGGTRFVTEHKLNEDRKITPVQQKKKRMAPERVAAASNEVKELRKARILRETRYQTWITNTVMVKKTDGA
ncbi:hypothetical protein Tco_1561592 [Tanacetum coccineum]